MNGPNILTIARFFLTGGFIVCALRGGLVWYLAATAFFALAAATDYYDGYLARKYNLNTDFGKLMDPIADKFLILSAFFVFMRLHLIPDWMFYVTAVREILVTVSRLRLMSKGKVVAAEKEGKIKTVLQMTGVSLILIYLILSRVTTGFAWLFWVTQAVMGAAVAMTVYSGVTYFWYSRQK